MNSCTGENGLKCVHAEGRGMNVNEAGDHFYVCKLLPEGTAASPICFPDS